MLASYELGARLGRRRALPLHDRLAAHARHRRLLRRAPTIVRADLRRAELDPHPGLLSARRARREARSSSAAAKLNVFLDVQNVTNRKNPEEIIYNYNFTPARLHHRLADAGGARREGGVLMRRARHLAAIALAALGLAAAGASPTSAAPPSLVTGPRILAVRGTPPEATPADGHGDLRRAGRRRRRAGRRPRTSAGRCARSRTRPPRTTSSAAPAWRSPTTRAATCSPRRFPADACTLFGPPPSMPGARPGRSRHHRRLLPAGARRLARERRRRDRVRARAGPLPASAIAPTDIAGKYALGLRSQHQPDALLGGAGPRRRGADDAVHGRRRPRRPAGRRRGQARSSRCRRTGRRARPRASWSTTSRRTRS